MTIISPSHFIYIVLDSKFWARSRNTLPLASSASFPAFDLSGSRGFAGERSRVAKSEPYWSFSSRLAFVYLQACLLAASLTD